MKKANPTSPARRQVEFVDWRNILTKKNPEKGLTFGFQRRVGRNSQGRITVRHKGAGAKRLWREVDFKYERKNVPAKILAVEYDPNRTSFIALIQYEDGKKSYILAPQNIKIGSKIIFSENAPLEPGNRLPLAKIPIGTLVYNIELEKGREGQIARSAGVGALVIAQEGNYTTLQMPSKEIRLIRSENWASVGSLSNPEHNLMTIGKAGRARHLGIRPSVRGSAMNPVDHPHGGGEGRTQRGRRRGPATPWGKPARGVKTRNKKKKSSKFILQRRK